ncbi:MAG: hypothetical protein NT023_20425 [Armatimonadetes bacterium]|nr:hypothetical protein [Armatimonadota bacterium]
MATAKKTRKTQIPYDAHPSKAVALPKVTAQTEEFIMLRPRRIYTAEELEEIKRWLNQPPREPSEAMIRALKTYKRLMSETVED